MKTRPCSVESCSKPSRRRGLCPAHYDKLRLYGDPLAGKNIKMSPPGTATKFFREVVLSHQTDDCLLWPFARNEAGYAHLKVAGFKSVLLSRIVCELVNGAPNPSNLEASHTCGRGHEGCVNPRHVVWKTRLENQHDRFAHGTARVGEFGSARKLTAEAVLEIRANIGALSAVELAKKFDVRPSTVLDAIRRKTWRTI